MERDELTMLHDDNLQNVRQVKAELNSDKNNSTWKQVMFGSTAGILLGAGGMYAGNAYARHRQVEEDAEIADDNSSIAERHSTRVVDVDENASFSDAFNQARAEVGSGGVFHWHGGLYSTYSAEEWNKLSDDERNEFAADVRPEVNASDIDTSQLSEARPEIHVHIHTEGQSAEDVVPVNEQAANNSDFQTASIQTTETAQQSTEEDVHVVGQGYIDGHTVMALDSTGDGQADVAIVDMDDSGTLSNPDIIFDEQGNYATVGQLYGEDDSIANDTMADPNLQQTAYENPDVAPDTPDYMNDADMSSPDMGSMV